MSLIPKDEPWLIDREATLLDYVWSFLYLSFVIFCGKCINDHKTVGDVCDIGIEMFNGAINRVAQLSFW